MVKRLIHTPGRCVTQLYAAAIRHHSFQADATAEHQVLYTVAVVALVLCCRSFQAGAEARAKDSAHTALQAAKALCI